jgi:hypothetical protein
MNPEPDDRLPELSTLPREVIPGAALEARTIASLAGEGLLHARRTRSWIWQAAAAVVIFVAGIAAGRTSSLQAPSPASPTSTAPRFLLLLHGGPAGVSAAEEARVVEEYAAWARSIRAQGRFVSGERLGDAEAILPDAAIPEIGNVRGFFLISAASFAEAVEVARSCPHAGRGGRVIVRPIDPT